MAATAATRIHRPTRTPSPMATSPRAITSPTAGAMDTRWERSPWMGLERSAPMSWAWMEMGLEERKKSGLASFWSPAKRKVTPRKSRSGSRYQPVAILPSGPRRLHMEVPSAAPSSDPCRAVAARTRRAELEVNGSFP